MNFVSLAHWLIGSPSTYTVDVPQQDALVVANWRVAVDPRAAALALVTGTDPGVFSTVSGLPASHWLPIDFEQQS